jgi:hypothetical protein
MKVSNKVELMSLYKNVKNSFNFFEEIQNLEIFK